MRRDFDLFKSSIPLHLFEDSVDRLTIRKNSSVGISESCAEMISELDNEINRRLDADGSRPVEFQPIKYPLRDLPPEPAESNITIAVRKANEHY